MKFKQYLTEKTFRINKDVDYIYNKYFKKTINRIQKNKWNGDFTTHIFPSSDLPSKISKNASKTNNVMITVTLDKKGNFYNSALSTIQLTLNVNAINFLKQYKTIDKAIIDITPSSMNSFKNEFTQVKIKGSIYHELSHWLDDTLHNKHITNLHKKAEEMYVFGNKSKALSMLKLGDENVGSTYYEINAQIHSIKQLKRIYKKVWDTLSFDDMLQLDGGIKAVYDALSYTDLKKWKKKILLRLHREKLLGKLMK